MRAVRRVVVLAAAACLCALAVSAQTAEEPSLVLDTGGHTSSIQELLFTRDGRFLISLDTESVVRVWDIARGEVIRTLRLGISPGSRPPLAALSPDERILAVRGPAFPAPEIPMGEVLLVYDFATGRQLNVFPGLGTVEDLAFSLEGLLAIVRGDRSIDLWNPGSGPLRQMPIQPGPVRTIAFSPDGKLLASGGSDSVLRWWEAESGILLREIEGHEKAISSLAFTPDGTRLVSGSTDGSVRLWDVATGATLKVLAGLGSPIVHLSVTPGGDSVLVGTSGLEPVSLVSLTTAERIASFPRQGSSDPAVALSPDGTLAAMGDGRNHTIHLWDLAAGNVLKQELAGQGRAVHRIAFAADGRSVAFGQTRRADGGRAPLESTLWLERAGLPDVAVEKGVANEGSYLRETGPDASFAETPDGRQIDGGPNGKLTVYGPTGETRNLVGHTGDILAVAVSPDGRRLVSGSADQTLRLWDLATGTNLLSVFVGIDGEWVAWTPEGYYTSSLRGDRYIGWQVRRGTQRIAIFYPAAQFQKQYYQPDVVAAYVQTGELRSALEQANASRGLPGTEAREAAVETLLPPEIYVALPDRDGLQVRTENLRIKAAAFSSPFPVQDFRVSLNGAQVYPLTKSAPVAQRLREVELEVTLKPGANRLSFVAEHAKASSTVTSRLIRYDPPPGARQPAPDALPDLFLLAIGISDYKEPALQLSYADDDARALAEIFQTQEERLFGRVEARILPDPQTGGPVTRDEVVEALDWFSNQGTAKDVRILFLSGHGGLDTKQRFYFYLQDQELAKHPETKSIGWDRYLESLTAGLPQKILMIDACHAGAVNPGRSRADLTRLVKETQNNDIVIFAASRDTEESKEDDAWKHGAFTHALLEGLKGAADGFDGGRRDGRIEGPELGAWIKHRVPQLNDQQHPLFDSQGIPPFEIFRLPEKP